MLPLHGIGVLVTRPRHQAASLCRLLEAQGRVTVRFAAVEIEPLDEHRELGGAASASSTDSGSSSSRARTPCGTVPRCSISGAISRLPPSAPPRPARSIRPAIGWRAIHRGRRLGKPAASSASSTRLRASASCSSREHRAASSWSGSSQRRGAQDRRWPRSTGANAPGRARRRCGALEARFAAREHHAVTATSVEIAGNLLALATPALRRAFDSVHWVVPSARVAESLREGGVKGASAPRPLGRGSGLGVCPRRLARARIVGIIEGIE